MANAVRERHTSSVMETALLPHAAETRRVRVLVVDDNAGFRESLLSLLDSANLVVIGEASSGLQALDLVPMLGPDVVLMDVNMPEMDGLEATRRIRATEAASGTRVPIVALTANAFGEDRAACLAAGMDDFLVKPLERERLAELLAPGRTSTLAA